MKSCLNAEKRLCGGVDLGEEDRVVRGSSKEEFVVSGSAGCVSR